MILLAFGGIVNDYILALLSADPIVKILTIDSQYNPRLLVVVGFSSVLLLLHGSESE
jgi:hypothetical protein